FLVHAQLSVNALQKATHAIGRMQTLAEPLKIGASPTLAASFVVEVVARLRSYLPNVQAAVHTGTTVDLMERLREREFDLLLCRHAEPDRMTGLSFEHLYVDRLVLAVRPGHPLA